MAGLDFPFPPQTQLDFLLSTSWKLFHILLDADIVVVAVVVVIVVELSVC